jgi:hypothetical protein
VGGGLLDAGIFGEVGAADEIPAADDDRQLDAGFGDFDALGGDIFQLCGFESKAPFAAKSLAAYLEKHSFVFQLTHGGAL